MQIVLKLIHADGTSDLVTVKAGHNFRVPEGVSVELVGLDGVQNIQVEGGQLVLSGADGVVHIAGLSAEFLGTTASIAQIGFDGPVPDGYLHLLAWSQDVARNTGDGLSNFDTGSNTSFSTDGQGGTASETNETRLDDETISVAAPQISSYSDDTGTPGDGITSDASLQLTGTATSGAEITVYDGADEVGTTTARSDGTWQLTTPDLSDGDHAFTVVASASGVTSAPSDPLAVTVDTTAPAAPVISSYTNDTGLAGDGVTSDNTLTLAGTAEANAAVQVFDGSTLLGSATADGQGAWTFTTAALPDATHVLTAVTSDAAGNVSASSSALTVTIDTSAPAAPTIDSFAGDSGAQGDGITRDTTLTLNGSAESGATVTLFDGGTQIGTTTADGAGNWTFDTSTLGDGAHSFKAAASDTAGNLGDASAALAVVVDSVSPATPTISGFSDDTGIAGDGQTADSTLTFTGTAEAGATVALYADATQVGEIVADGTGHWSVTTTPLANGAYAFTAVATDAAGNDSFASSGTNVTVNATAPDAPTIIDFSSDTGTASDGLTSDTTPTLTGTAQTGETVSVYDGVTLLGTTFVDGSGHWSFTSPVLGEGTHSFTATATNGVGTTGDASVALDVTIDTTAPAAPVVFSISDDTNVPSDGQTSDNTLTFVGHADAGSTVNIYVGADVVATGLADADGNWTATTGTLTDGYYSFDTQAFDAAGNASAVVSGGTVAVDTTAPAAPVISSYTNDTGVSDSDNITRDATLTLQGTAESGVANVSIYDGATLLGIAAVSGGTWTYATATLANGEHSLTAIAIDPAGNASAASAALAVTIDTVAPSTPAITGYTDDSGNVGDGFTNDNTLVFTGTADAGQTVNLYADGVLIATTLADGTGHWTASPDALADGSYSFSSRAVDIAGNISGSSSSVPVRVDTAAPAAPAITSFSNDTGTTGDGITSDTTLTLSGTAEANSTVTVFDGATKLGTGYTDSNGHWTFATGTLLEGEHDFSAKANDQAGNTSVASSTYSVTIDTTGPSVPTITSFSDDTGPSNSDGQTSDNTLTFVGTASAGDTVNIYVGAAIVATGVADGAGNWSATTDVLDDGYTSFIARAVDSAGNLSGASDPKIIVIDTAAPVAPVITGYSDDTGAANDGLTADSTLRLTGTATDGATSVAVYDGATLLGTTFVFSGTWNFDTGILAEGDHAFTAVAKDSAGNTSVASAALDVTLDLTALAPATITGYGDDTGSPDDHITSDNQQTLSGTAPEGSNVVIYDNGLAIGTVAASGTTWSFTTPTLPDGGHAFTVRSSDAAGNLSAASSTLSLTIDTAAPAAPEITSFTNDTGVQNDGVTSDTTLTLTGTAVQSSAVDIYDGATKIGSAFVDGAGHWSFNTPTLSEGEHDFTAIAKDGAGNASPASDSVAVTIDITPDAAPTITGFSDDTGTLGDSQTSDQTLTLTGTAGAGETVNVYWNGTVIATGVADGTGHWSATSDTLADGYYSLDARTIDTSGNASVASDSIVVIIDTTAPAVPAITGYADDTGTPNDGITADNTLVLNGTAEAGSTVIVYDGSTELGSATADNAGSWSFSTAALANGDHSFTAAATDRVGNVGDASAPLAVNVNYIPLVAPVITAVSDDTGFAGDGQTSDNTLTFTGTATAGLTVNVYEGATLVATGVADGVGHWTATTDVLADGHHTFNAQATNGAATSAWSSNAIVMIDTVAPAAPSIVSFENDSGVIGDGITNDNTLELHGTGEANTYVTVYDGATLLGTTNVNSVGNWIYATPELSEGTHSFTATPNDAADNVGTASDAFEVTIDRTRPDAPVITGYSDNSGNPNDYITNDNTLTFTGTALADQTINIYLAGRVVATGVADGDGNWSATTTTLADSSYAAFSARAFDTASNLSLSSGSTIVAIDTVAPAAPVITGYSNDTGVVGDGITYDQTLVLSGTTENNSTVSIYDGATLLGTASANSGNWTFTTSTLAAGDHSLTAVATDMAGNAGAASSALDVTIDLSRPDAPVITSFSDNSGNPNDTATNDNTLTFTGTAEAGVNVSIYLAGNVVATGVADGDGHWSATTGTLDDSNYASFTARASYASGYLSISSDPMILSIDTVAPAAPVITSFSDDNGTPGDGITNDTTITLNGTAAGANSVSLYDGATLLGVAIVSGGNWTYTTNTLGEGEHDFTAIAVDYAGNLSGTSAATTVTIDTTRPDTPVITGYSDNSGNPNDYITNDNTLTFTGTAEADQTVNIYLAGQVVASGVADGSGNWTATTGVVADSTYAAFTARAVDNAGNLSLSSSATIVAIDTVAPDAPAITGLADDGGAVSGGATSDNTLVLSGTAATDARTVDIYDGATLLGTAAVSGGAWTFTSDALANGEHSFTAQALDMAGNASTASTATDVTISTATLATPVISGFSNDTGTAGDGQTSDNTLTFSGTADAGTTVNVYTGITLVATGTADGAGHWTATTTTLDDGYYTFTAKSTDGASSSASSAAIVVVVDTLAPSAPVIESFSNDTGTHGEGVTSDNTLTLSGTTTYDGGTVNIYDGGALLGSAQVSGTTWTYNTEVLTNREHDFTAVAKDAAGNFSAPTEDFVVTVNATAASAPIFDTTGYYINDNTPTFTGTADADTTVNIYVGLTIVATGVTDGTGHWSATLADPLAEGYTTFYARAFKDGGMLSSFSAQHTLQIDTAPPSAPLIASATDNGIDITGITGDTTPTLHGTAEAGTQSVQVYDGATLLGTAFVGGGEWQYTTTTLSSGEHDLIAKAVDFAGNVSDASTTFAITIDSTPPGRPIVSAQAGNTSDNTPTFTGRADPDITVNVYLDNVIVATGVSDGGGNWTATVTTPIADGIVNFTFRAVDAVGNQSAQRSTTLIIDTVAPDAPVITGFSDDSGVLGDYITSDATPTLSGTVGAHNGTINVYDGATLLGKASIGSGSWTFTTDTLSDGVHNFTVTAVDNVGNESTASDVLTLTIDSVAPAVPTFTSAAGNTSDNTPTFEGTADAGVTVNVYLAGAIVASGVADGTGHWTATVTDSIADGYQYFTARAVNDSGASSAATGSHIVAIDTVAPDAPLITHYTTDGGVAGDGITNDSTPTLSGTAELGAQQVNVYDGVTLLGSAIVNGGTWSYTSGTLADGDHVLTAKTVDRAGNVSDPSSALNLSIDTVRPDTPTLDSQGTYIASNTPTFTGTATADITVNVYLNGHVIATGTADGSGHWSATTASALAEGYSSFSARAVDVAGNLSLSAAYIAFVDTIAPDAPTIVSFANDTDTIGDGVTTDHTLQFSGTAVPGTQYVNVYDGATLLGDARVSSGTWTFTTDTLSDGAHNFTATAIDFAGNEGAASAALAVTVDPVALMSFMSFAAPAPAADTTEDHAATFDKSWLLGDSADKSVVQSVSATSDHGSSVSYDAGSDTVTYNPQGSADIQALNSGETINDSFTYTLDDGSIHTKSIIVEGVDGYSAVDGTSANDNFYTSNSNIDHINGGAGTDTLHFQPTDGAAYTLDLTQIGQNIIQSVERVDLSGGVNSSLTLNAQDILSMSDDIQGLPGSEQTRLTVVGDAGDSVTVADSGWTSHGHLDVSGISFNVFEHGSAQLLVQTDIPTNGLPAA